MLIKKIDKLILKPFVGLFILTLGVAIFIILMQFFLIWFDELIGKDLGLGIYLQLFFYFGITATPKAFPLAILLASLIAFGNLGESLELTALKGAGISLLRILLPLIALVGLLSFFVFFSNNYLVPKVTVRAYNLLYDLRKKKPSIAIKEGVFYNGIPNYSIRVEKKLPDQNTLLDIIIYDHTKDKGNIAVTTAESGQLYTIRNDRYLVVELFNGHNYLEGPLDEKKQSEKETIASFYRTSFKTQKLLLDLDQFKLTRSSKDLFAYYHTTKNAGELQADMDVIKAKIDAAKKKLSEDFQQRWPLLIEEEPLHEPSNLNMPADGHPDSTLEGVHNFQLSEQVQMPVNTTAIHPTEAITEPYLQRSPELVQKALEQARDYKNKLKQQVQVIKNEIKELRDYEIEKHQRLASALGCIIMLLIGAPLGTLIKKGGLGVPLLISTGFILVYYIVDIFGVRWAKAGLVDSFTGAWISNLILLPFGLFFLRQAQKDSRLLDKDAYVILINKLLRRK
jgi:lipopolysaccharide export system permease protein